MPIINYLTRIRFDHGALAFLGEELAALGVTRPLLVTDAGVAAAGLLQLVLDALPPAVSATVFDATPANPTEAAAVAAAKHYAEAGCDGLLALGGGSPLDLAKAAGLLATHPGPLAGYAYIAGGAARIGRLPPLLAVPTTAGTGSEVGRGALIVLADGRKLALIGQALIPATALCDPDLTLTLPPGLTAATGMDALTHGIETFLSPVVNPPAEAIGLDAAGRAAAWLERAVADGADRKARWQMMMASMMGAMAFQKGLGAVHGLSHPLGALPGKNLHHGTLNAVLLPPVLRFNGAVLGEKAARLRATLGVSPGSDLANWVEALNARLGLPENLRAMGVTAADLPPLAALAAADHSTATNPRPIAAADYAALYRQALG